MKQQHLCHIMQTTTTTLDGENSKLPLATTSNEPETSAAIGSISTNSTEDEEIISTEALSLVLISQVQVQP